MIIMNRTIEKLLQAPYWIIDILPKRVPADGRGQYFEIEKYFLKETRLAEIKQKHINTVLKLNCYADISIDNGETWDPAPELIEKEMRERWFYIMVDDAMILTEPDDTHMTVFGPDEQLLDFIKDIAGSEGLFVWQPADEEEKTEK